jgi:hypothetical protein
MDGPILPGTLDRTVYRGISLQSQYDGDFHWICKPVSLVECFSFSLSLGAILDRLLSNDGRERPRSRVGQPSVGAHEFSPRHAVQF